MFGFRPESCSPSSRNRVRDQPGTLFGFIPESRSPSPGIPTDQWKLLASVQRIGTDQADWVVRDATRRGQVIGVRMAEADGDADEPWKLAPSKKRGAQRIDGLFPDAIEIVRGNLIFIPKAGLPEAMLNRVIRIAAFQNPDFYKTQAMRLPTWDKPRIISAARSLRNISAYPEAASKKLPNY